MAIAYYIIVASRASLTGYILRGCLADRWAARQLREVKDE